MSKAEDHRTRRTAQDKDTSPYVRRAFLDAKALARVVFQHPTPASTMTAPGRIILQRRDEQPQWVVHWQNCQDGGCTGGGYHHQLADALEDVARRVRLHCGEEG